MKNRYIYYTFLLFLLLFIQSTRFDFWRIYGIKPDLILLFVFMVGFQEESIKGTLFGFIAGLCQDMLSNGLLGSSAFCKSIWGYLAGKSNRRFDTGSITVQIGLICFFSLGDGLLMNMLAWTFHLSMPARPKIIYGILGQAGYNTICWPFYFLLIKGLEKRLKIK